MKRHGNSKTFIPSISVIFILIVSMMMTGCAGGTALTKAASAGRTEEVKALLDKGSDINEKPWVCEDGLLVISGKGTALSCAAFRGHTETVKLLLDRGADVNTIGDNGFTALVYAASQGHVSTAKLLIERGADVDYAMAKLKKLRLKDQYEFLERIVKEQRQTPKYQASPPMLPTALPLPTEPVAPF